MAANAVIVDEPPYEMNGSGMPVTGIMPRLMPTFSNTWKPIMQRTPTHIRRPTGSRASCAVRQIRQTIPASRSSRSPAPAKPSSSPATVKMKSVCCSGTEPPLVSGPSKSPLPVNEPEAIAICACRVL